MANIFLKTPPLWVIDTPGATILSTDMLRVKSVSWVGATTATHAATLQDAAGNVVWTSLASGANYVERDLIEHAPGRQGWNGLQCPTLASGKLYVEMQ